MKLHCNSCGRDTTHELRSTYTSSRDDLVDEEVGYAKETITLETFECRGCEELCARMLRTHEAFGEADPEFFPAPIWRRRPQWHWSLPKAARELIVELYKALQNDSPRLAAMGARAIIDVVLNEKVGNRGSFEERLKALTAAGYVGEKNREFLAVALDAGSAAAHRGLALRSEELGHVIDIVENLLEAVYILGGAAEKVKKVTPPRP